MNMPDINANGPLCINPAAAVWTLARELVDRQRSIAELERSLAAMLAENVDIPEEIISLNCAEKNAADLLALKWLWYSKTLPSLIAKFAVALEAHETVGDGAMTTDDPLDVAVWRNKYIVAFNDMTITF